MATSHLRAGHLRTTGSLAIAAALALGGPARAQTTAAAADANASGLEEIIVTAQKRSQNLQDVPLAVSAISSDALKARGITNTTDLFGALPSLQVTTPYGKTQPNFSLRGVSVANEFTASTASPVGVYVDEVYQSFRASHGQQLYDLDRVEVLRGPQGTLYGRNTTGGAISFFTKRPELDGTHGSVTLGYANYNTKSGEAVLDTTLVPGKLGVRIAGTFTDGDGWQYNPTQKRKVGTSKNIGGRLSLRWKPSDDLDINFKVYGARDNPLAPNPYAFGQLSGGRDVLGYSRFDPAQNGGRALNRDEVAADTGGNYFSSDAGASLSIDYKLNDHVSLTSITGFDYGVYNNSPFDCDGSPNSICELRYYSNSNNFNQDLRVNYKGDKFTLIAGAYFGIDKVETHNQPDFFGVLRPLLLGAGLPPSFNNIAIATNDSIRVLPAFAVNPALTPSTPGFCAPVTVNPTGFLDARSLIALLTDISINNSGGGGFGGAYSAGCRTAGAAPFTPILGDQYFNVRRPSKAIYADGTLDVSDKLSLSAGLRYTWDSVTYYNGLTTVRDLGGQNIVASTIPYSYPYNPALARVSQTQKAQRLTGRANASYHFTDEVMGYIQYSRGYRSGSYNGLAYQGTNQVYYIQPEQVNAYEGGLKMRLFDRRVQLNVSGFYYDYKNQQFTQVIGATTFTRSGNGRLYGGEAELAVKVAPTLRFDATLGLLNTRYSGNILDPANPSSATLPINGNPFPNAPSTTFSAGFDWDILSHGDAKLTLRGDTSYEGKYYFDPFKDYGQSPCGSPAPGFNILQAGPAIACGNPSYWLFNARLTYDTPRYAVSIWGKNISNKVYYTYGLNINIFSLDYLNRGQPRTFGIEGKFKF